MIQSHESYIAAYADAPPQAPALTIDSSTISESAYIIHRLLSIPSPNRGAVESTPSDDSVYWAAFAEGSLMNLMQAELTVAATAKAWEKGMVGGLAEEGKRAVGEYGKWMSVSGAWATP
jgi:glutathione S-transferase